MRLIGPSPICPQLLKLTIILPNLACVTAEDKCTMPSPRAARETLSHIKCQSMPFNTPGRFNIDRLKIEMDLVLFEKEAIQIHKKIRMFTLGVHSPTWPSSSSSLISQKPSPNIWSCLLLNRNPGIVIPVLTVTEVTEHWRKGWETGDISRISMQAADGARWGECRAQSNSKQLFSSDHIKKRSSTAFHYLK